ncbi:hypothetical protein LINGRAHAP2_LOCUS5128 [Linum grandiflorum]
MFSINIIDLMMNTFKNLSSPASLVRNMTHVNRHRQVPLADEIDSKVDKAAADLLLEDHL